MGAQDWGSKPPKVHSPTEAATMTLDPTIATIFRWTPTQNETVNAASPGKPDEEITVQIDTAGVTSYNVTFGTYFRTTGVLASGTTAARRFQVGFKSDGTVWSETFRTAAMA